jgi:hypothetical protein
MASLERKSFSAPDETRPAGKAEMKIVSFEAGTVGLGEFQPGWQWSKDVQPIVGGSSCQAAHFGYVISGRLAGRMDDGTEFDVGPGDVVTLPAGHDAWVVGEEPCRMLDWAGAANYAKTG